MYYTWDEIYKKAEDAACGEPALRAKDEARHEVRMLMLRNREPDPDKDEIPEDSIENYCNRFCIRFGENGDISLFDLPDSIAEAVYRQRDNLYLREDIVLEICVQLGVQDDEPVPVDDGDIWEMMQTYKQNADCNIPYNVTIENAVRDGLKKIEEEKNAKSNRPGA